MSISLQAQNERKGFSFQGYARDFDGAAYSSSAITAQFTIYPEGESNTYTEQHSLTTDAFGVFHAVVGSVIPVDFAKIDFSKKKYFMKVEVKVTGGDFVLISNTELLAVPYAKAAEKAVNGTIPGTIISFAGAAEPAGYLICDGRSVTVAAYPELYAAIGNNWGGDGTNFNLPDLRGQFLRGQDGGVGVDPDRASRTAKSTGGNTGDAVGSYQTDIFGSHTHTTGVANQSSVSTGGAWTTKGLGGDQTGGAGGSETRPKNAYVLYVIKY